MASDLFEMLLGSGTLAAGLAATAKGIQDTGADAAAATQGFADNAILGTEFQPYTVRGTSGSSVISPDGSINLELTPEYAQAQQALLGASGTFRDRSMLDIGDRTADIFQILQDAQQPSIDRDRLALESRVHSQGRSGVRAAGYGGTPEQFAMEQAILENKNKLSVQALGQALGEQAQNADLSSAYLRDSFAPQASLLELTQPQVQLSNLQQTGQIAGQNLASQLRLGGLQTQVNADVTAANLYGGLWNALGNVGGAIGSRVDDVGFGGFWDEIKGAFGL